MPIPWLPSMVSVNGDWTEVCRMLYGIYEADFIRTNRQFIGMPIWRDRRILPGERYEECFWHLISREDYSLGSRLPDLRRAERLPWCGPTISNAQAPEVKVWDYLESSGKKRTYVWLEAWDYVIIIEKRRHRIGEIAFLVTAYHVDGASVRLRLGKKFTKRVL